MVIIYFRSKCVELDQYVSKLKCQISEHETKHKDMDDNFGRYKEQQNAKPEVRLQSEINLLTLEKVWL